MQVYDFLSIPWVKRLLIVTELLRKVSMILVQRNRLCNLELFLTELILATPRIITDQRSKNSRLFGKSRSFILCGDLGKKSEMTKSQTIVLMSVKNHRLYSPAACCKSWLYCRCCKLEIDSCDTENFLRCTRDQSVH